MRLRKERGRESNCRGMSRHGFLTEKLKARAYDSDVAVNYYQIRSLWCWLRSCPIPSHLISFLFQQRLPPLAVAKEALSQHLTGLSYEPFIL